MTTAQVPSHPLLEHVATARNTLAQAREIAADYLPVAAKAQLLQDLAALEAQVAGLRLRALAAAGDLADEHACRDAGAWYAVATRTDRLAAHADLKLANALETYGQVDAGLAEGRVNPGQARVIVHALDQLPEDLDPDIKSRAEAHLVELVGQFDPRELRLLGQRILEVIAPQIADEHDAKALEREEQRAREKCSLRLRPQGDGTTRMTGLLPDADAARLETYLDALTSPRVSTPRQARDTASSTTLNGERFPRHRLRGQAFCTLLEHLDPATLPDHGGDATTVAVTLTHDDLTQALGTATLDAGLRGPLRISATEARRLACTAKILPAVLGGNGEVLDLGRTQRLYNTPQRKALRLRDQHCRAEGCTVPVRWTEAHHLQPWSRGGKTDLADGVLLCSHHHHRAHDNRFETTRLANGDLRFHRRT